MKNGGYKGNSKGELIVTVRVTQPAKYEACLRVGGNGEEDPETSQTVAVKES